MVFILFSSLNRLIIEYIFLISDEITAQQNDPVYYLSNDNYTQSTGDSENYVYTDAIKSTPIDVTEKISYPPETSTQNPTTPTSITR